jgi:hypothetical protein
MMSSRQSTKLIAGRVYLEGAVEQHVCQVSRIIGLPLLQNDDDYNYCS